MSERPTTFCPEPSRRPRLHSKSSRPQVARVQKYNMLGHPCIHTSPTHLSMLHAPPQRHTYSSLLTLLARGQTHLGKLYSYPNGWRFRLENVTNTFLTLFSKVNMSSLINLLVFHFVCSSCLPCSHYTTLRIAIYAVPPEQYLYSAVNHLHFSPQSRS